MVRYYSDLVVLEDSTVSSLESIYVSEVGTGLLCSVEFSFTS